MTLIVASLVERSIAGASRSSKTAFDSGADVVELRLDHLEAVTLDAPTLSELRDAVAGPAIATLRSRREGGLSTLAGEERSDAIRNIIEAGFEYVDLELEGDEEILRSSRGHRDGPRVIASSHFSVPASARDVEERLRRACAAGDIGKVAMPCEHALQALALAGVGRRLSEEGHKFAVMGMGDQGRLTRVCASAIGSRFVYSCLPGKEAAPGQLDIASQRSVTDEEAVLLGLLGHPVSHSVSRPMHEAALSQAGLPGAYLPLDIPPGGVDREVVSNLRDLGFRGINVTIPHKVAAFETCTVLESSASETGAVNTLRFSGEDIVGENTDVIGFERLIEGKIHITESSRILVVGAGGAARAVVKVLISKGGRPTVTSRRAEAAAELARAAGGKTLDWAGVATEAEGYDIVVNCTPVGMRGGPEGCPVPDGTFKEGGVFFDLVYNPETTPAMETARSRGAQAFNGLEMLVGQGARSFEAWTGVRPDVGAMADAARRALE